MTHPNNTLNLPKCIWFTGLSGAGKTTIAQAMQEKLQVQGRLFAGAQGGVPRGERFGRSAPEGVVQ